MDTGREYLHRVNEALTQFEKAVEARARPGILRSKVTAQQEVDRARQEVLDVVAQVAAAEWLKHEVSHS